MPTHETGREEEKRSGRVRKRPSGLRKPLTPIIAVVVAAAIVGGALWILSQRPEPPALLALERYGVLDLAAPDEWKKSHEVFLLLDGRRVSLPIVLKGMRILSIDVTGEAISVDGQRIPLQTEPESRLDCWGPILSFFPAPVRVERKSGRIAVTAVSYCSFRPQGHPGPDREITWEHVEKRMAELPVIDLSQQETNE